MIAAKLPAVSRLDEGSTGIQMSPEEFDAVEDYDPFYRYELINGVVIVSSAPGPGIRGANDRLGYWLRNHRETHPLGHCIDDTVYHEYIRVRNGRRMADRVVWTGLLRSPVPETDPPTIAVEFVSSQPRDWRRDHLEKRFEYAQSGVTEYWVIDRFRRTMTVYSGESDELTIKPGETYRTDLLPGFELPLNKILAVSDRYTQ